MASKGIIEVYSYAPSKYILDATISRKEVMKVVMNISGEEIEDTCREIYADVPLDWSCKYIESALDAGYIASNAAFRPDDTITQSEALKLILQTSGIKKRYNTGSWQQDYISTAYYLGLIPQKFTQYNIEATRGWIFRVASASMKIN